MTLPVTLNLVSRLDLTDSLSGKLIIVDESEDSAIVAEEVEGSKTRRQAKGSKAKAKAKHAPQVEQNKSRKARGTNEVSNCFITGAILKVFQQGPRNEWRQLGSSWQKGVSKYK